MNTLPKDITYWSMMLQPSPKLRLPDLAFGVLTIKQSQLNAQNPVMLKGRFLRKSAIFTSCQKWYYCWLTKLLLIWCDHVWCRLQQGTKVKCNIMLITTGLVACVRQTSLTQQMSYDRAKVAWMSPFQFPTVLHIWKQILNHQTIALECLKF